MVESNVDSAGECGHIVVSPNLSSQWHTTKILLWIISCVALLIGIVFASLGLWVILPFAGLEVLALVLVTYWVACRCRNKQVIRFGDNRIRVEEGYLTPRLAWDSELFWTRLIINKSPYRGHPSKLILRSRQQQFEIGEFLNEHDKKKLIAELRNVIGVVG